MQASVWKSHQPTDNNIWASSWENQHFAYAKTKTQISCAVTAKLINAFVFATRILQSLYFLNPKFQAFSHLVWLYSLVCVGPGRKPRRPVFSQRGSSESIDVFRTSLVAIFLVPLFRHFVNVTGHKTTSQQSIFAESTATSQPVGFGELTTTLHHSGLGEPAYVSTDTFSVTTDLDELQTNASTPIDKSVWKSNGTGHISQALFVTIKQTLWFYVVPIVLPIGILGNILGVCFLNYRRSKQSFYVFLLALISSDLVYLLLTLLQNAAMIMESYNKDLADTVNCYIGNVIQVLQWNTYSTCTHLVCLMACERLINIMRPFWRRNENFHKRTVAIIVTIIVTNIILRLPALLKYEITHQTDPSTNLTKCVLVKTTWLNDNMFWHKHYVVVMLSITQVAPLIATIMANISIVILLSRQREQRAELFAKKETRAQHYQQYITTLTLIILSVCLSTSLLPSITMAALKLYLPETYGFSGLERFTALAISEIGFFLRVISSSTDFVIYIWLSTSSRKMLLKLIKRKLGCKTDVGSFNDLDTIAKSKRETGETSLNEWFPFH